MIYKTRNRFTQRNSNVGVYYSGSKLGNTNPKYGNAKQAKQNRYELYKKAGLSPESVIIIGAKGKDTILDVSISKQKNEEKLACDGLITKTPNQGLLLLPADCIPLVMYSKKNPTLALIHVGRTGVELGIHTQAISRFIKEYGATPNDIEIYVGPHIKKDSYSYATLDGGLKNDLSWKPFIKKHDNKYYLDLLNYTISGILKTGIPRKNITISSIDTGKKDFFSHRKARLGITEQGRNGFLVLMKS